MKLPAVCNHPGSAAPPDQRKSVSKVARVLRPLNERFWAKVDRSGGPNACWPWTGAVHAVWGYGFFKRSDPRRNVQAHRLAWELANDRAPAQGMEICHTCDNEPCCNPAHLWEGTRAQNAADMVAKGRSGGAVGRGRTWSAELRAHVRGRVSAGETRAAVALASGLNYPAVCRACRDLDP